jgi:4-amino-4-deoxy-L-arabinose transferase-like glycosyltransferase
MAGGRSGEPDAARSIESQPGLPGPAQAPLGRWFVPALVGLLFFALVFQGSRGLMEPDEGRYSVVASQMLLSGDFLCPALNDDVPHFTKPPLTYWAIAGGTALLGRNEWGARLPYALAYIGAVLVVYAMARTITPERPWLAPLVYAMFPFPYAAANVVTTDTLLTLWEAVAALGFVRWWAAAPAGGRGWRILMWAGFGMAFLTKGPPGLLPLVAMVVAVWLAEGRHRALRLVSAGGLAVFVLLGVTWYLLVILRQPHLARYFVEDEVVRRVTSASVRRNPEWYKPFVMYLPVLVGGTLPWTFMLLRTVARTLPPALRSRAWWRSALATDRWGVFLGLWFWLPCTVFCLSRSRMYLYMLPLFVPLALVVGRRVGDRRPWLLRREVVAVWLVLLVALRGAVALYPSSKDSRPLAQALAHAAGGTPSAVLFVDGRAAWAVGYYLGCQVKEVISTAHPTAGDVPGTALLEVQLAKVEPGALLVVESRRAAGIAAILEQKGYRAETLAAVGRRAIVAPVARRTGEAP